MKASVLERDRNAASKPRVKRVRDTDPMRNFSKNPLIIHAPCSTKADPPWWKGGAMDIEEVNRRRERSAEAVLQRAEHDQSLYVVAAAADRRAACGHTFGWPEDGSGNRMARPARLKGRKLNHRIRARWAAHRGRSGRKNKR